MMNKSTKIISWIAAVVAVIIMLQTLYFKFTAAPESVFIFTTLGLEPYGRIGVGVLELIASVLLLIPVLRVYGAVLGVGLMLGALGGHVTKLGIVVMNDGGYLFGLCISVLLACCVCLYIEKSKIYLLINRLLLIVR